MVDCGSSYVNLFLSLVRGMDFLSHLSEPVFPFLFNCNAIFLCQQQELPVYQLKIHLEEE